MSLDNHRNYKNIILDSYLRKYDLNHYFIKRLSKFAFKSKNIVSKRIIN